MVLRIGGVCVLEELKGLDRDQVGTEKPGKGYLGKGMSEEKTGGELTKVWIKDEPWWGALGFKFEMERVLGKG